VQSEIWMLGMHVSINIHIGLHKQQTNVILQLNQSGRQRISLLVEKCFIQSDHLDDFFTSITVSSDLTIA
jgi:hypothetical protein